MQWESEYGTERVCYVIADCAAKGVGRECGSELVVGECWVSSDGVSENAGWEGSE